MRICLACRTLLGEGETCGAKGHRAVDLGDASGRADLLDEVWGPASRARALRQIAKGGAGGGLAGTVVDACSGCDASSFSGCDSVGGDALIGILVGIVVVIAAAIVGAILFFLIKQIVAFIRAKMDRPKPHGALLGPPKTKRATHGAGTVRNGESIAVPWREGKCLAYAFELHEREIFGGGAMLRDARTGGFEVTLDDGRVLRVPAGRVRIFGPRERMPIDATSITPFLHKIDPSYDRDDDKRLFPHDHGRALTILSGDRVEVLGDVEVSAGDASGYRENASVLVPVGVPVLRVRKADDERVRVAPSIEEAAEENETPEAEAARR